MGRRCRRALCFVPYLSITHGYSRHDIKDHSSDWNRWSPVEKKKINRWAATEISGYDHVAWAWWHFLAIKSSALGFNFNQIAWRVSCIKQRNPSSTGFQLCKAPLRRGSDRVSKAGNGHRRAAKTGIARERWPQEEQRSEKSSMGVPR